MIEDRRFESIFEIVGVILKSFDLIEGFRNVEIFQHLAPSLKNRISKPSSSSIWEYRRLLLRMSVNR